MEDEEKVVAKEQTEIEILKEKISQLEYELTHYKSNNEDLISKLAKADRQVAKANSYNEELRLQLDTLSKELHGYRKSQAVEKKGEVKDNVPRQEIGVQVNSDDFEIVFESKALPDWTETSNQENTPIDTSSIADSLKAAAEAVLHSQGSQPDSTTNYSSNHSDGYSSNQSSSYVWDDNYQMYYDYNSGYYLDTANNLYYDPNTGTYFFYNNDTQKYEFHSQVSVTDGAGSSRVKPTESSRKTESSKKSRSENHGHKSRSHLEKDMREVRHRDSPRKKERSKYKKQKRSRFGSRERDRSSKKRKKSKSRKHKKESKEENEEKRKHGSTRPGSHRSRKSKHREKSSERERNCETITVKEEQDGRHVDEKQNKDVIPQILSTELELMETNDIEQQILNANSEHKVPERLDTEKSSIDLKKDWKSKNNSEKLQSDSSAYHGMNLKSVKREEKMELSEDESNSVCSGESELESGELSTDSSDSDLYSDLQEDQLDADNVQDAELIVPEDVMMAHKDIHGQFVPYSEDDLRQIGNEASATWPPCIRVMVNQSECLDIGDLFIVTCTGGTIGREKGKNHVIEINHINISKSHCSLRFDYTNNQYVVKDDGSQHGTFINNIRLSQAHEESTERGITHGDVLKLGTTELLLHIHPGTDTCTDCEPGEVKARVKLERGHNYVLMTAEEKKKQQKQQLKSIKKRYGLKNMNFEDNEAISNPAYEDKAATRRKKVGSDGPGHKTEAPASVHKPISQKNKGHKLLAKMGWKEGEGLGKSGSGIIDPINATFRANQSAGFGSSSSVATSIDNVDGSATKKASIWKQTRERFDKISKQSVNIFELDSDVDIPKENG